MIDLPVTEPFRVYSERELETHRFAWSPHMDLLATLSSDGANPHVSVWRLIEDKQSNSALLFSEKIPFKGTSVAWVPDKRSLAVGDTNGNVFVYDAECQRSIELQKVQDCAISSLQWIEVGNTDDEATSRFSKLPSLSLPFTTISNLIGDITSTQTGDDIPPFIECDSLGCGKTFIVMGVLGVRGKTSLYAGGSIPIAEFSIEDTTSSSNFADLYISPDISSICTTCISEHSTCSIVMVNSAILKLRSRELYRLTSRQARCHWLLKNIHLCLEILQRATQSSSEDLQSFVDLLDLEEFLVPESHDTPPGWTQSYSLGKLLKLARSSLNFLDYLAVSLVSTITNWIDHLTMTISDIVDMSRVPSKYGAIHVQPLIDHLTVLRKILNDCIFQIQRQSRIFKWIFYQTQNWILSKKSSSDNDDPLLINLRITDVMNDEAARAILKSCTSSQDLSPRHVFEKFSASLVEVCKSIEESLCAIQSNQRKIIGSHLVESARFEITGSDLVCCWSTRDQLDFVYTENGDLLFSSIFKNYSTNKNEYIRMGTRRFQAPESLVWRLPQFYREKKICAILEHGQGVSIALVSTSSTEVDSHDMASLDAMKEIVMTPEIYGVPNRLMAQQLPEMLKYSSLVVSASRGLCSIHSSTSGRLITLDLEPDPNDEDDAENDDVSMRQRESVSSGGSSNDGRLRRSKSWFDENKFFNADGLAYARRKVKEESDSEQGEQF